VGCAHDFRRGLAQQPSRASYVGAAWTSVVRVRYVLDSNLNPEVLRPSEISSGSEGHQRASRAGPGLVNRTANWDSVETIDETTQVLGYAFAKR
jgi:hypothetical protein